MNSCLLGFDGNRFDSIINSTFLGNGYRANQTTLMRFHYPDNLSPFGAGGINPYIYCADDPVNNTDPTGHLSWQAWLDIGIGIVGLGGAIFTLGTSIAAGGIMTTMETISLGTLEVMANVTAMAGGTIEDNDPAASAILGWVSLSTGVAGMVQVLGKAGYQGINKLGHFVGDWQYKLQHAGACLSKQSSSSFESGIERSLRATRPLVIKESVVDTALINIQRSRADLKILSEEPSPEEFYRGDTYPLHFPVEDVDDRLVKALIHTSRISGSAGEIQSFTSRLSVASNFAEARGGRVYIVKRGNNQFMSTAEIVDKHADRLVNEKKILSGTVLKAVRNIWESNLQNEREYFWISNDK